MSGGTEYAMRLREVEAENARLRAEVEREKNAHAGTAGALGRERARADAAEAEVERLRAEVRAVRAERDPEARLRAFAERYRAQGLSCSFLAGTDVDRSIPWTMEWRRRYADADSDYRTVNGRDLSDVVAAAEAWEAENDRRGPQHAEPARVSQGKGATKGER